MKPFTLTLEEVGFILAQSLNEALTSGSPVHGEASKATVLIAGFLEELWREQRIKQVPRFVVRSEGSTLKIDFISKPEDWIY